MSSSSAQTTPPEGRARGSADPSGRLLLRMPRSLHGALAQVAERDGTSLNQLITGTLASAIGWTGEGAGEGVTAERTAAPATTTAPNRTLMIVLVANAVAVGVAALAAIALLLYALFG